MVATRAVPGEVGDRLAAAGRVSGSLAVLPVALLLETAERSAASLRLVMRRPDIGGLLVAVYRGGRPVMVFSPADGRSLAELLAAAGEVDRSALDQLAKERPRAAQPLQRLVIDTTGMSVEKVQRYLDFQARQRLLDVLTWRDGFFQLEQYGGVDEVDFTLALPSVQALAARAEARAARLPSLLAGLPAAPRNTVVRRRRGGGDPATFLEERIVHECRSPQLLTAVQARTLVDDDILIDAVLSLVERQVLRLEARARLVAGGETAATADLRTETLVRDITTVRRGEDAASGQVTLWIVVTAADFAAARGLVTRLAGDRHSDGVAIQNGVASVTVQPSAETIVSLLAVQPSALTQGALEGVMGRCDGVILAREGGDPAELTRLAGERNTLLAVRRGDTWSPPVLGLDLGAALREWEPVPDAVLGLPDPDRLGVEALLVALLEGVLAATHARATAGA